MSDAKEAPKKDAKGEEAAAGKPKKGGGGLGAVLAIVLSTSLAGGAAFAGARAAMGHSTHHEPEKPVVLPPGPTVPLEPFLANVYDSDGKAHAIKMTLAVELARDQKEDEFKIFVARIRDVTLSYIRALEFETLSDPIAGDKIRKDLLEKWHSVGAAGAQQVLITDLIMQ